MRAFTTNPQVVIPVWDAMMRGARRWAEDHGFTAVHGLPGISGAAGSCEAFENTYAVENAEDFFGKRALLVQSGQLYLEYFTQMFEKVYAEIQSYRKEPEVDNRHLCQFTLFEIEHLGDLDLLMQNIEDLVKSSVAAAIPVVEKTNPTREAELTAFVGAPIQRISYREALDLLLPHFPDLVFGDDLKAHHEAKLVDIAGGAVLAHSFETNLKFFSMVEYDNDPTIVKSCDLLLPFAGESAGAAERSTSYDDLKRRLHNSEMYHMMKAQGVKDEEFDWYLDQHKEGTVQTHSGAGIGMARVAQFILGTEDIREAVPFVINRDTLL